jgi:hypothetical protein
MSKWHIEFVVDAKNFATLMEMLVPMKVEDLNFKIVAGTAKHIRPGDQPIWTAVVDLASDKPQPMAHFREGLRRMGVKDGSIYNALNKACENRVVRKVSVKGATHFVKEKVKTK